MLGEVLKSETASGDLRVLRIDCAPAMSVGDLELEVAYGDSWYVCVCVCVWGSSYRSDCSDRCTSCECEVS